MGRAPEQTNSCHWAVQANRAMNIDFASLYYNLIGNIVGSDELLNLTYYNNGSTPMGQQSLIIRPASRSYDSVAYSFSFGYGDSGDGNCGANPCSDRSYTTVLLHGNYDYVSHSTTWDPSITDHALPASLYRSAKPSWFGLLAWPAFGPDPKNPTILLNNNIPAKYCYEQGLMPNCLAGGGDSVPPSVPKNLRIH